MLPIPKRAMSFDELRKASAVLADYVEADLLSFTKDKPVHIQVKVAKADDEQRLVYAWASVIEENGKPVVDWQGDVIMTPELLKTAHRFIGGERVSKVMHDGEQIGETVESMVFTKEMQAALGIDLKKVGWLVVMKIAGDAAWAGVKDGTYKALSIGGRAQRHPLG